MTNSGTWGNDSKGSMPPRPVVTPLTQFFWDGLSDKRLLILRCSQCQYYVHYPRPICTRCGSFSLAPHEVSGKGTLYAFTVTTQAFDPYFADKVPYTLAIVELVEQAGLRMTTMLVDEATTNPEIGRPVEVVWTSISEDVILPYFKIERAST